MSTRGRESVLAYLRRQGGDLLSADGRGITHRMAVALGYKLGSLGRLLSEMEQDGLIEREVRGKRTYRIRLREDGAAPSAALALAVADADGASESASDVVDSPFSRSPMEDVLNL